MFMISNLHHSTQMRYCYPYFVYKHTKSLITCLRSHSHGDVNTKLKSKGHISIFVYSTTHYVKLQNKQTKNVMASWLRSGFLAPEEYEIIERKRKRIK